MLILICGLVLCCQLCSLVNVLNDLSYGVCFYVSGDFLSEQSTFCKSFSSETQWVLALLPYWFRFAQCLKRYKDSGATRQLWNAGKYALSLNTTFWSSMNKHFPSTFTVPWVACAVISTLASYSWDLKADWGLLEWRSPSNPADRSFRARMNARFLRRQRVLRWSFPYYFAMVSDGLFRLAWVATISSPDSLGNLVGIPADYFKSIIYSLEVLRRNQWSATARETINRSRATRRSKRLPACLRRHYFVQEQSLTLYVACSCAVLSGTSIVSRTSIWRTWTRSA